MTIRDPQSDLLRLFERSRATARGRRWQKVLRNPRRMICSKALELALGFSGRTLAVEGNTFWGDSMRLFAPEAVSMTIHRYGFFDEGLTGMLLEFLRPGMTFYDVGAHFGYFTALAARIVGETGKVHAFEPTPGTFSVLAKNAAGRRNVALNNVAVDSESGSVLMNDCGLRFSAFNSLLRPRLPDATISGLDGARVRVRAVTLDDYAARNGFPGFVKIDAEGSEHRVLRGMGGIIGTCRPIVAVEVGDWGIDGASPCRDVVRFLLDRGYGAHEYRDGKILRHGVKERYGDGNLLFLPE